MADHKTVELGENWLKVDKKVAAKLQSQIDLIMTTVEMSGIEVDFKKNANGNLIGVFFTKNGRGLVNMKLYTNEYYLNKVETFVDQQLHLSWQNRYDTLMTLVNLFDSIYDIVKNNEFGQVV